MGLAVSPAASLVVAGQAWRLEAAAAIEAMMILRMLFLSNAMTGRPAMGRELTGEQGLGNRAAKPVPKRKGAAGKPSTPFCFFGPEEAGKKLTSWLLPSRPWRRRQLPAQRRQLRPPWRSEEQTS